MVAAMAGAAARWDTPQEKPAGPAKVQAEYETGYRFLKAGDYKKAIKSFEKVLKENPSHALAYSNMGYSYRKLKQYDKAVELYGKALMIDPKLAEAHEYIGEAYLEMGKIEEAKQHLTILERPRPEIGRGAACRDYALRQTLLVLRTASCRASLARGKLLL